MCMGCGISKFDHEEAGPTFKRPTKRNVPHSNIENDGTLASEQLLHEYGAKDESSSDRNNNNDRKSVSSCSWTGNKWEPDIRDQVNAKNKGGGVSAGGSKDQLGGFDRKIKVTAEEERGGGGGGGYNNSSEREKNEEENGSFSDREDDIARPASPSFREYCVDSRDDINEGMIGAKGETDKAQADGYLNSEMAQGSEVAEVEPRKRRRSPGRGLIKSAIQRPAGWIQRQK